MSTKLRGAAGYGCSGRTKGGKWLPCFAQEPKQAVHKKQLTLSKGELDMATIHRMASGKEGTKMVP